MEIGKWGFCSTFVALPSWRGFSGAFEEPETVLYLEDISI